MHGRGARTMIAQAGFALRQLHTIVRQTRERTGLRFSRAPVGSIQRVTPACITDEDVEFIVQEKQHVVSHGKKVKGAIRIVVQPIHIGTPVVRGSMADRPYAAAARTRAAIDIAPRFARRTVTIQGELPFDLLAICRWKSCKIVRN